MLYRVYVTTTTADTGNGEFCANLLRVSSTYGPFPPVVVCGRAVMTPIVWCPPVDIVIIFVMAVYAWIMCHLVYISCSPWISLVII